MDVVTYALSRKYTDNSIAGTSGVLAGKNCTIASITPVDGGNLVTFEWVADDSTTHTDTMFVQDGILGENDIAPTYDPTVTYSEGNLVVYNNELYRCTSTTTGEFDPSDWESISINEILGEIEIALAGKADSGDVPTALADLSDDSTHRLVTDAEKNAWNGKQNALTFDDVPMDGSNNPVKSNGIYDALAAKANSSDIPSLDATLTNANAAAQAKATGDTISSLNNVLSAITAKTYDSTLTYKKGDYVIYDSKLYRSNEDIDTAESFASAKWLDITASDDISVLRLFIDYLNRTKKLYDFARTGHDFLSGYAINNTTGTVGSTTNTRYFACSYNYIPISDFESIYCVTNPSYINRLDYAFFDESQALIGSVTRLTDVKVINKILIPSNAKYINVGGYSAGNAYSKRAIDSTFYLGDTSIYYGTLDTLLTSTDAPAQGKAVGDAISSIINTGINKLRITPNTNDINFAVKTGITNLYIGYAAGGYNGEDGTGEQYDDGKYNVAIGVEAFRNNVSGDHCTVVGFTAMKYNESGDFNTCLGEDSLYANVSGSNNIAIGDHAGQNNNGNNNILIGARVMRPATNASGNIIIGKEAGSVLDTGGNNILIGNSQNPSTDSSNNIMIGDSSHTSVVVAGKLIHFNNDGTVTWETLS